MLRMGWASRWQFRSLLLCLLSLRRILGRVHADLIRDIRDLLGGPMKPGTGKSIWAVVAGVLFIVIVTTLVDILLHLVDVFPPMGQPLDDRLSLIALSYRIPITIAGAYLTAKLAPANPMKHAMILGVVGTLLGGLGVVATMGKGMGPAWYPISLAVLAIPQCWLGGVLYLRHTGER
jgi:hypothetical protein